MQIAIANATEYPTKSEINPAVNAPENIPTPIMKLFTPRYVPSKPFGIVLKRIIEFDTLKIENAETIIHDDIIAIKSELLPIMFGIKAAAVIIPKILGMYDICVARSSVILAIKRGTKKNIVSRVIV